MKARRVAKYWKPGSRPGLEGVSDHARTTDEVKIELIAFDRTQVDRQILEPEQIDNFEIPDRTVVWVNVDGVNKQLLERFRKRFDLHTLACEDVINVPQRPKVELYNETPFIIVRIPTLEEGTLHTEQISAFLLGNLLLTFQEDVGDIWDPVRDRIDMPKSRLRRSGSDYLLYALIDSLVDQGFPILESFTTRTEDLERRIMENAEESHLSEVSDLKQQLSELRSLFWPMRDLSDTLMRDEELPMTEETRTYLRDVYDHVLQLMDLIETKRETVNGLADLHLSAVSMRLNEVMKVLTVLAGIFAPITFIAGVYGMNFQHIPELDERYAYPIFWMVCGTIAAGLFWFFRRKGWL